MRPAGRARLDLGEERRGDLRPAAESRDPRLVDEQVAAALQVEPAPPRERPVERGEGGFGVAGLEEQHGVAGLGVPADGVGGGMVGAGGVEVTEHRVDVAADAVALADAPGLLVDELDQRPIDPLQRLGQRLLRARGSRRGAGRRSRAGAAKLASHQVSKPWLHCQARSQSAKVRALHRMLQ